MERYNYINGETKKVYDSSDDAMRAYAKDGFPKEGKIVRVSTPDPLTPEWLTVIGYAAGIVGFADSDADIVQEGLDGEEALADDALHEGVVSLYSNAVQAVGILAWLGEWAQDDIDEGRVFMITASDDGAATSSELITDTLDEDDGRTYSDDEDEELVVEDLVEAPPAAPPTSRVTVTRPPAIVTRTVAAATFSPIAAARIDENNRWLAELGVVRAPSPTTTAGYRPGTTVVGLGYENLATKRREWEENPRVADGAAAVIRAVQAEEREDVTIDTRYLRLTDDGSLDIDGRTLSIEPQGFADLVSFLRTAGGTRDEKGRPVFASDILGAKARQLATLDDGDLVAPHALFPRAGAAYLAMDPDIRATAFNRQMRYAGSRELVLRTRVAPGAPGGRAAFAVVSTGYTAFDADQVARTIADGLGRLGLGELRGEAIYNPAVATLRMDAFGHADTSTVDFAAGDVFKAGMRFRSDDAGGGSVRGGGAAWWNECLNLIIIHAQRGEDLIRLVHKGTVEEIDRELRAGLGRHGTALRHFARQWNLLGEVDVAGFEFRGVTWTSVEEAVSHLVGERELDGTTAKNALAEYVLTAHAAQGGGDTLQSIIDAITRAAHESIVAECVRERIEGAAGRLVPVLARAAEA